VIILAGDIGATKTHLALYHSDGGPLLRLRDHIFATQQLPNLEAALVDFIKGLPTIDRGCLGVPGPITDGLARPTNIGWAIDEGSLSQSLGGAPIRLVNDLVATAYGMLHLPPSDLVELHQGHQTHRPGNIAVIAAGTGLGEAGLIAEENGWTTVATEGGHCDFAPRGAEQVALLQFLEKEFGHVSYERTLSGPGLHNIYRFLLEYLPAPEPQWLSERMRGSDPSAVVSAAALAGEDERCVHTVELFTEIYGAEAANLALKFLAFGGVYVGGGIAPKILPFLQKDIFMRAFFAKGRLGTVLEKIPVRISLNQETALLGAAHLALTMK
jgi:glucokinase